MRRRAGYARPTFIPCWELTRGHRTTHLWTAESFQVSTIYIASNHRDFFSCFWGSAVLPSKNFLLYWLIRVSNFISSFFSAEGWLARFGGLVILVRVALAPRVKLSFASRDGFSRLDGPWPRDSLQLRLSSKGQERLRRKKQRRRNTYARCPAPLQL